MNLFPDAPKYNGGPLTFESLITPVEFEQASVIADATEKDYRNAIDQYLNDGYITVYDRTVEKVCSASLKKGESLIHLTYLAADSMLIITPELNKLSSVDVSYSCDADEGAEFYMYGLNMDPGGFNPNLDFSADFNTSGFVNCGMLLAARASDDSIIVIDGGKISQFPNGAISTLNRFLHKIARKKEGEVVTISAWYISHAHDDHYGSIPSLLEAFHDQYKLERILANFPERQVEVFKTKFFPATEAVKIHYPDVIDYKLHTGDRITLGDITLNVLYTHECATDRNGVTQVVDFNDTTTVAVLESKGMRVMILGDISELAEDKIVASYTKETLHSDIVQVAHHNFNHLVKIYKPIGAPIACFTQTLEGTRKNESTRANAKPVLETSSVFYYNGDITKTVGFGVKDGEVKEIFRYNEFI